MDLKPKTTGLRPTAAKCVPECVFQHSCFIFVMCLLAATPAPPQTATDGIKLGDVDFTATLRVREYVWNWFEPAGSYENQYAYSGNILRLNFARAAWCSRLGCGDGRSVSARYAQCCDGSGAPGRARTRRELFLRECKPPVRGHGLCETALRALSLWSERISKPESGALRIWRWH